MVQPACAQQRIISLLIQEQLSIVTQSGVDLAVLVDVRGHHPRARVMMDKVDSALADVDEKADILLASVWYLSKMQPSRLRVGDE